LTDDELVAGRVGRPHGLDGSFYVVDPEPRLLEQGRTVRIGERTAEIVRRAGTDARPILRLAIAGDRDGAEALRGAALMAPRGTAPELDEDEYWAEELVGCVVVAGDRELGAVERLVAYPSCEVLVVGELLVPLVRDAVRNVDPAARRIEVDAEFLGL
jgi:16S rRNA processing protein RimM